MLRPLIVLACIFVCGFSVIYDGFVKAPERMQRNPDNWQTYRCYVNHGIAAREAGHYNEALTSLLYAYQNLRRGDRSWLSATVNLAMCCEVLGQGEAADRYYMEAGKFCNLANNMRTAGAWRKMRREIEEKNAITLQQEKDHE